MRWRALALLMIAALSGCAASAQSAAEPVGTDVVLMPPSYRFDPVAISVPAGTTVAWFNRDNFSHSVQVTGTDLPFLELSPGESGEITFAEPGQYPYVCTFHSQDMKGTVIVTEP